MVKVPLPGSLVRHIVHQTILIKASVSIRKAFRQVTKALWQVTQAFRKLVQGTLRLANSQIASSMTVEAQLMAVVQNRFGIYPLVEGPARHVHPKTTTFCLVLGFTPSGRPSRAHQSQNDLEQLYSGPLWPYEWSVCHIPVFPTCNVRKRRNSKCQQRVLVTVEEACLSKVWLLTVDDLTLIRTEKGSFSVRIGDLCRVARCLLRQVRRRAFLFQKYFRKLCKFIWICEDCPIYLQCNSELIQ